MRRWLAQALESVATVYVACALTWALGLFFTFIWAPHPFGWQGIDQYHELARGLARGESFATTDVPWAYAYYIAALYAAFGEHTWIPVLGQTIINAMLPWLLYLLVQPLATRRIAVLSAVLTGLLSFNTVYASTQSTDSICTVLFASALLMFSRGVAREKIWWYVVAGALLGMAAQFRPNLILFPPIAAGIYVLVRPRRARKLLHAGALLLTVLVTLLPWIIRNHRLTGLFLPTSTHGAVQLWYGTLQVGPYLENRAANPRAAFGPPSFPYTTVVERPLLFEAPAASCGPWDTANVRLVLWTDRDNTPRRFSPSNREHLTYFFAVPPQPAPTVLYYYLEASWPNEPTTLTPSDGVNHPAVHFVSRDHLVDLDVRNDLLDIFDIVRMIRAMAWAEPTDARTDFDRDSRITRDDLVVALRALLGPGESETAAGAEVDVHPDRAILRLGANTLEVPRTWRQQITDLIPSGHAIEALLYTRRSWNEATAQAARATDENDCRRFEEIRVNQVFYRAEVDSMRRYSALALDNIQRDPGAFLVAAGYRMLRLFIVRGSDDPDAVHQFEASGVVYGIATAATAAYLLLFVAGVVVAAQSHHRILVLLVPILYVPLTICFVLTNMRYTITMQPFMFAFIAVAVCHALFGGRRIGSTAEPHALGTVARAER
jgi:hypothetical protein